MSRRVTPCRAVSYRPVSSDSRPDDRWPRHVIAAVTRRRYRPPQICPASRYVRCDAELPTERPTTPQRYGDTALPTDGSISADRQIDRHRQTHRQTYTQTHTYRQTDRQIGTQTDRKTDRQADRQAGRQADRQTAGRQCRAGCMVSGGPRPAPVSSPVVLQSRSQRVTAPVTNGYSAGRRIQPRIRPRMQRRISCSSPAVKESGNADLLVVAEPQHSARRQWYGDSAAGSLQRSHVCGYIRTRRGVM